MKIAGTLYQARNGAIILLCGNCHTEITRQQIDDLHIDVYNLDDFSLDDFKKYYGH